MKVIELINTLYPEAKDKDVILDRVVMKGEPHKIIDEIRVEIDEKHEIRTAALPGLSMRNVMILDSVVETNPQLLMNNLYIQLQYYPSGDYMEHRIPGSLALIIFRSVEEHIGENGLNMFLKRAGLEQYIDNPPPDDDTPTIEMSKFKKGIQLVIELFGEKAAKPLLLRWGKLTFEYALKNRPTLFGLAGLVTTFMSEEGKIRFILKRVLKESENLYDVPHILTEDETNFVVEIENCFYCGDLKSQNCICWPPVGFWTSMMKWITGKEHDVKEIECRAQGKESCKFIISKKGTG